MYPSQPETQPEMPPVMPPVSERGMTTFNVVVPVVANVNADSAADAYQRLEAALREAGFEAMDTGALPAREYTLDPPFVAEAGTAADL